MTDIQLVPIDNVHPSAYNPRITDPLRLRIIELSLRKLGFVSPICADANGEILSGHQRYLVATEQLGLTHVPVMYTKPMALDKRRNINVVFNRATNDLARSATPTSITDVLNQMDIFAMGEALPDKTPDQMYPCMATQRVPLQNLITANAGRWVDYARNISKTLANTTNIVLPIVATPDYVVTNGIGRLQYLAEKNIQVADVVFITHEEARFADAMLNYLSMDFDIHTRYADVLRHNSFRRTRNGTGNLATGHLSKMKLKNNASFDFDSPHHIEKWRGIYGETVLDFWAGWRYLTKLKPAGIRVDVFEPYCIRAGSNDVIDREESVRVAREFLACVRQGIQWDSMFLSAVMNSVPFAKDREHIITILSALCSPKTTLHSYTTSTVSSNIRNTKGNQQLNANALDSTIFALDYEPNILLGEFDRLPKVQKFFGVSEYSELHEIGFLSVRTYQRDGLVFAECKTPKPISRKRLREALEFEFDLPYPDGERMGLVKEACLAFGARLGIALYQMG